jgi:hypothetical protein
MRGWTSDEQLSLIAAIKTVPSERSLLLKHCGWTEEMAHLKYLQLLSELVPGKSTQECEQCLRHLVEKRVAYFGQPHSHPGGEFRRSPSSSSDEGSASR